MPKVQTGARDRMALLVLLAPIRSAQALRLDGAMTDDLDAAIARVLELDAISLKELQEPHRRIQKLIAEYRTLAPALARECQRLRKALEHIAQLEPGYVCDPAAAAIQECRRLRERVAELEQDISYLRPDR